MDLKTFLLTKSRMREHCEGIIEQTSEFMSDCLSLMFYALNNLTRINQQTSNQIRWCELLVGRDLPARNLDSHQMVTCLAGLALPETEKTSISNGDQVRLRALK
ncbi:hypothetical protein J5N97_007054 [Dioscorea zingiberensis]|uniref:Uncharacterized protein n=1 Tax=Dioscorea zingiberensis TaxID=325984 RepID=A0A9D5HU42_9LILI|nr:hypothetical protein J5N97_007054 [Dioscorea zingiberensis]